MEQISKTHAKTTIHAKIVITLRSNYKNKLIFFIIWLDLHDFWSTFGHIYTVFYKESESEVKKCEILEPGGKK